MYVWGFMWDMMCVVGRNLQAKRKVKPVKRKTSDHVYVGLLGGAAVCGRRMFSLL